MKQTRLKRAARILSVYRYNFGVTPPYQIVIDGTYAQEALKEKLNLAEQLPKYLGAPVEIHTTKCCLDELTKLGPPLYGALCIAKLQLVADCPHNPPRGAGDCLAHLARRAKKEKKRKYIFATQDQALQEKLRAIGGIPILYIAYKTVLLDPVSEATKALLEAPESAELEAIKELKKEVLGEEAVKKKRKKKGVNPLSCKKKTMKKSGMAKAAEGTKTANGKRRRKKKEGGGEKKGESV